MSKEQFFDIGVNLTHPSFDKDLPQVISEALSVGVKKMCITGIDLEDSIKAVELSLSSPETLISTAGIHPHNAKLYSSDYFSEIYSLFDNNQVVAIGETGLDFYRNYSSPKEQKKSFEAHLEAAIDLQIPLFLHVREAHKTFFEMLNPVKDSLPKTVVHCFTGSKKELIQYIEMNFYIGLTGWICDERRGGHLKELVHLIPSKKLLCETDAPYLIPRDLDSPNNGRNEPKYLPHIVNEIASNLNEDRSKVANRIYKNSCEFFDLDR